MERGCFKNDKININSLQHCSDGFAKIFRYPKQVDGRQLTAVNDFLGSEQDTPVEFYKLPRNSERLEG